MKIYYLEHLMIYDDDENTKFIGIFSSRKKALKAVKFLSKKNGFNKAKDLLDLRKDDKKSGFILGELEVNQFSWKEGFG